MVRYPTILLIRLETEYVSAVLHTLGERIAKGEKTLLQYIKAVNAAGEYIVVQAKQYRAQLGEKLVRARAEDEALLRTVAVDLGVVATAALVIIRADANYRIANAQTAIATTIQLQAFFSDRAEAGPIAI